MRIDGKAIADHILDTLRLNVAELKKQHITPTLGVILVGDDPGSLSYIKQKQKAAESIGAKVVFEHLSVTTTATTLAGAVAHYNNDSSVHGLIIQRPVPLSNVEKILGTVTAKKDVDGFLPNSAFQVPVARAVISMLDHIHRELFEKKLIRDDFMPWLKKQPIAILGRGETAGRPIARLLENYGCATSVIHSQTPNSDTILHRASIIISCIGKKEVITKRRIKTGVILISVGLWRDTDGKLHGDYEEDEIKNIASFYAPTPGGVGPVNVACLMQNLIEACILQKGGTI